MFIVSLSCKISPFTSTVILRLRVAARNCRGHVGDVADLAGEVGGHGVDVIGEILPGARDAGDLRLAAQLAIGAHFARDAADLGREGAELIDHRIDGFLELAGSRRARRR